MIEADSCVDVVIVNYNSGHFLKRCLASLASSTQCFKAYIVDNASSDDSLALCQNYFEDSTRFELIQNTDNVGFATAVNQGAKAGTGAFVFVLNPDCELFPHTLAGLVSEALKEPSALYGALVLNEDGSEQRGCRRRLPNLKRSVVTALGLDEKFEGINLTHLPLAGAALEVEAVSGAAMLMARPVFEALEGFDDNYFLHVEDIDICRRAKLHGIHVALIHGSAVFHHQGVSSRSIPFKTEWYKLQGLYRYLSLYGRVDFSSISTAFYRVLIAAHLVLNCMKAMMKARGSETSMTAISVVSFLQQEDKSLMTGASSDLGQTALNKISGPVLAVSRKPSTQFKNTADCHWFCWSFLEKANAEDLGSIKQWYSFSPIWGAPSLADCLGPKTRLKTMVAVSSTSIEGKSGSTDTGEQLVVKRLLDGESCLHRWADEQGVRLTVLRPTLVYGGDRNKNIRFLEKITRIFRCFPLVDHGVALRQPIHIDDLADVSITAVTTDAVIDTNYNVSGGETLSYKTMVQRLFEKHGHQPRFVNVRGNTLKHLLKCLRVLPGCGFLSASMVDRMQQDLVFSHDKAKQDLDFTPRRFEP